MSYGLNDLNPIAQVADQVDTTFDSIGNQIDELKEGDIGGFFEEAGQGLIEGSLQHAFPYADIDDQTLHVLFTKFDDVIKNYDWEYWAKMFGGGGAGELPGLGGGGMFDFPESEKRHTGGPSSGDFYMDIYSGGLEGGNVAGKKYGLGAPENANYRGVLGVY